MITFHCYRSPKERLEIWLEKPHDFSSDFFNGVVDFGQAVMGLPSRTERTAFPNKEYFDRARDYLIEKGETDAKVYLIRSEDGEICRGSARIPLRVETPQETYVIKTYDHYDPTLERKVLETVSGKVAPTVLHLGSEFYAEEFIDASYKHLETRSIETGAFSQEKRKELWQYTFGEHFDIKKRDRLIAEMVEAAKPFILQGAKAHAQIAQLGVVYHHNHWLDEFHMNEEGRVIVTDFGTSYFFLNLDTVDEEFQKLAEQNHALHEEHGFEIGEPISSDEHGHAFFVAQDKIFTRMEAIEDFKHKCGIVEKGGVASVFTGFESLSNDLVYTLEDPSLAVNLSIVLNSSTEGIKRFFEDVAIGSGHDYARLIHSDFRRAFFESYFSS